MADGKIQVIMDKDDLQPLADSIKALGKISTSEKLTLTELEEIVGSKNSFVETCTVNIKGKSGAEPYYIVYNMLDSQGNITPTLIANKTTKTLEFTLTNVIKQSYIVIYWGNATYGATVYTPSPDHLTTGTYAYKMLNDVNNIINTSSSHTGGSN